MTPEERARALRNEADTVLEMVQLREHCASIGQIIFSGSYFLDLMMYPDIDLYLPLTTPKILFALAAKFAEYDFVKKIIFEKGEPGELEKGFYLKPIIEYGNWKRPWKIDIWSLPLDIVNKKQKEIQNFKDRMTPAQRKLILEYKYSILTETGRTPMYSGIYVYRAIIDLGLKDFNRITDYLKDNGIEM